MLLYSYIIFYAQSNIFCAKSTFLRDEPSILHVKTLVNERFGQKLNKTCIMATIFYTLSKAVRVKNITLHVIIV